MRREFALCVGTIGGMPEGRLRAILGQLGLRVTIARSCSEAQAYLRFSSVRLLVVGLDDPCNTWGMLQAAREVRGDGIVVVCASERSTRTQVLSALRRGAHSHLAAPFALADLEREISPLLSGDGEPGWTDDDEPTAGPVPFPVDFGAGHATNEESVIG